MVSDSYARYIKENYKKDTTIITVGLGKGKITSESYEIYEIPDLNKNKFSRIWQRLFYAGNLFGLSGIRKHFDFKDKISLFVFNDNEPITNKFIREVKRYNSESIVSIIDEGIGVYTETIRQEKSLKQKIRLCLTGLLGSPMQYKAIGDNPLIDVAVVGNVNFYKSLNKAKNQIVLKQQKDLVYKKASDFLLRYYGTQDVISTFDVLYLGQPFRENEGLLDCEKEYLEKIFECLPSQGKVAIKPHPRDIEGKYNCFVGKYVTVLDKNISKLPLECMLQSIKPKIIIAHNSSAALNIANSFPQILCCMTYKLACARETHEIFKNSYSYSNYDDNMFTSIYGNLIVPKEEEELSMHVSNKLLKSCNCDFADDEKMEFDEIDFLMNM